MGQSSQLTYTFPISCLKGVYLTDPKLNELVSRTLSPRLQYIPVLYALQLLNVCVYRSVIRIEWQMTDAFYDKD